MASDRYLGRHLGWKRLGILTGEGRQNHDKMYKCITGLTRVNINDLNDTIS